MSQQMKQVITELAQKHGVDLGEVGSEFKLTMKSYMPLVVEVIGKSEISVAHYFTQNGDAMRDPEIVFNMASPFWEPVEITQDPVGRYEDMRGNPTRQRSVDSLALMWARNLKAQGWLKDGVLVRRNGETITPPATPQTSPSYRVEIPATGGSFPVSGNITEARGVATSLYNQHYREHSVKLIEITQEGERVKETIVGRQDYKPL